MQVKVYVTYKKEVLDPQGKAVQEALTKLGFEEVREVRQGKYFDIYLSTNNSEAVKKKVNEMSKKLLSNPVIEDYRFDLIDE